MTTFDSVLETSPAHIVGCGEGQIDNLVGSQDPSLARDCVIRIIRGQHCHTTPALFQEFAAALQFPDYFGHNWDALDECLSDLEWLPARGYILVITNAERVLSTNQIEFDTFCSVLMNAKSELRHPTSSDPRPGQPRRLDLILQAEPSEVADTKDRFNASGIATIRSDELLNLQWSA